MDAHPGEACTDPALCFRQTRVQIEIPHHWIQTLERWMDKHGIDDRDAVFEGMIRSLTYRPRSIGLRDDQLRGCHALLSHRVEQYVKRGQSRTL
jgi:metal-responsive CopG/Arc/MetJ family transcriptional regulator